jgi:hypothetical protein
MRIFEGPTHTVHLFSMDDRAHIHIDQRGDSNPTIEEAKEMARAILALPDPLPKASK